MRAALLLTTALIAATPAVAQSWTQATGSNGTSYNVLVLDPPGDTDPLLLLDDPTTGALWYFDQSGSGPIPIGSLSSPSPSGSGTSSPPSAPATIGPAPTQPATPSVAQTVTPPRPPQGSSLPSAPATPSTATSTPPPSQSTPQAPAQAGSNNNIIWGAYGQCGTITQDGALAGASFTTTEAYIGQPAQGGWAGWNSDIGSMVSDAVSRIPPSAGGQPMVAISPDMSGDPTTTFNEINSGQYDSYFNSLFQAYAQAGYTQMSIRPLWEFNLGSVNSSNQQAFIQAFQRIANLAHSNTDGIKVDVIWNPGAGNTDPIPYYPGDQYVDMVGIDESAGFGDQGNYTDPLDLNPDDYKIGGAAAFAAQHNKPLAIPEGGVATGGYTQWLGNVQTALNETGAKLALYGFYDATDTGANECWQQDQADTSAVKNFVQNAPGPSGTTASTAPPPPQTTPSPPTLTMITPPPATVPAGQPVTPPPAATPEQINADGKCGTFSVANGQIIGPNGQPFIARGVNIYAQDLQALGAAALTNAYPALNFVRLGFQDTSGPIPQNLFEQILALNAKGVVVEITDYNYPTVLSGGALSSAASWYSTASSQFLGDPLVWFGTQNEPDGSLGTSGVQTEISTLYQAVRQTGNNTVVMVTPQGGTNASGLNLTGMTNVAWDLHYYNWISGYSSDPGTNSAALANEISNAQSATTSGNGTVPVIIGEWGDSTNGANTDQGWQAVVNAVELNGVGNAAFVFNGPMVDSWNGSDQLLTSNGSLSPYGQAVAPSIAQGQSATCQALPTATSAALAPVAQPAAVTPVTTLGPALSLGGGMTVTPGNITPANTIAN